jgi:cold shock protein
MATGIVKWWSHQKGYGFIVVEGGKDVFVHHTGLGEDCVGLDGKKNLAEGQRVEFSVEDAPKGPQAVNVKLIE